VAGPAASGGRTGVVGWLDGAPLTYGDVARHLRTKDPEAFGRGLEGVLLERVTRLEADALGVEVPAAAVERATNRRMIEWERRRRARAEARGAEDLEPAVWLERTAGVSLARFRGWVRRHTETELLQDRLVRFDLRRAPTREISLLVVADEQAAREAMARLEDGTPFAEVARGASVHASRDEGGRIPYPLRAEDVNDAAVREALFAADAGRVLGPFPAEAGGETFFQVYRVERARAGRAGPYGRLAEAVETSLKTRPVHVGEYERWRRRALLRHGFVAALDRADAPTTTRSTHTTSRRSRPARLPKGAPGPRERESPRRTRDSSRRSKRCCSPRRIPCPRGGWPS